MILFRHAHASQRSFPHLAFNLCANKLFMTEHFLFFKLVFDVTTITTLTSVIEKIEILIPELTLVSALIEHRYLETSDPVKNIS